MFLTFYYQESLNSPPHPPSFHPAALHHLEMFVKYRLMGGTGKVEYAPLKEERAVEVGSEMIGEMVIYGIAAGILFYEFWSSKQQSEERDRAQDMRITSVKELVLQQEKEIFLLRSRVDRMEEEQRQKKPSKRTAKS